MKMDPSPYEFLAGHATPARGNVTVAVTDALRRAIVTLELKPGEVIDKGAVCERLSVSRFPVSEALARLQAEGLVDILPQRGSTVSYVRIADVVEYMLIRKALESEAVRVLVARRDAGLVEILRANLEAQHAAAMSDDREGFHGQDLEFHDILFEALNLPRIKSVIDSARGNLDRARRLIITPRRLSHSMNEHRAIFEAIAAGDAPSAEREMRGHIDSVMREFFQFARQQPQLFADGDRMLGSSDTDSFPFG